MNKVQMGTVRARQRRIAVGIEKVVVVLNRGGSNRW